MSIDVGVTPPPKSDQKAPLTRALPSSRMSFTKQLDLIRAYGVLGGNGTSVKLADAAEMVKVHPSNVSTMNPFMLEIGIVAKSGTGTYSPELSVMEFARAYAWNPETAAQKLAPLFRNSWFGQILSKRAAFGALSEEKAIEALAIECSAGPEYRAQVRMLIDYAESVGLIRRENGQIVAFRAETPVSDASNQGATAQADQERVATSRGTAAASSSGAAISAPTTFLGADGAVSLNVSVHVNLAELKGWPADRITAFFAGIAQVVAAQEKGPK